MVGSKLTAAKLPAGAQLDKSEVRSCKREEGQGGYNPTHPYNFLTINFLTIPSHSGSV
jgi:hypothetical protein